MKTNNECLNCGNEIPAQAPAGECPTCALSISLELLGDTAVSLQNSAESSKRSKIVDEFDGRFLATKALDGTAHIIDAATGNLMTSVEGVESLYGTIVFSHDNRFVSRAIAANAIGLAEVP